MKIENNFVVWDDKYSIGIPLIDSQHKELIALTNELYKACRYGDEAAKEQFRMTIHEAAAYVKFHFSVEEQIMQKAGYPDIVNHKKYHAEFVREVLGNVSAFETGKRFIPQQFARFLWDWILSHIAIVDTKLGSYLLDLQRTGKLGVIAMKGKEAAL